MLKYKQNYKGGMIGSIVQGITAMTNLRTTHQMTTIFRVNFEGAMTKWTLMFGLALILIGCVSSPIDLSDTKIIPANEVVVFGRVKVMDKDKPREYTLLKVGEFQVYVLPDGASIAVNYALKGDGSFYWHLPPGTHIIVGFKSAYVTGRIWAQFLVPKDASAVYIGTLEVNFDRMTLRVEDDFERSLEKLKNEFPQIKGEILKNLMHIERQI
jgi:hypothetical protein